MIYVGTSPTPYEIMAYNNAIIITTNYFNNAIIITTNYCYENIRHVVLEPGHIQVNKNKLEENFSQENSSSIK